MLKEAIENIQTKLQRVLNPSDKRAKIQDYEFIIGLLQATSAVSENFTLASLRLSLCNFVGTFIGQSTFNERLATQSLTSHFKALISILVQTYAQSSSGDYFKSLAKSLGVESILGVDGSIVTLCNELANEFKGTFTAASIKLHMSIDLVSSMVEWIDFTPGSVHDSQRFPAIHTGYLYITDLGYWSIDHFERIISEGGYYLSRVKSNCNLVVTEVISGGFGASIIGENLCNYRISRKRQNTVEFKGTLSTEENKSISVRIIGSWNYKKKRYHWYITNLKASKNIITRLYKLRWQIEISFKALKSGFKFDQVPAKNANSITNLCLMRISQYLLSAILRAESADVLLGKKNLTILRTTSIFRIVAHDIYTIAISGFRMGIEKTKLIYSRVASLIRGYQDPNHAHRFNSVDCLKDDFL